MSVFYSLEATFFGFLMWSFEKVGTFDFLENGDRGGRSESNEPEHGAWKVAGVNVWRSLRLARITGIALGFSCLAIPRALIL